MECDFDIQIGRCTSCPFRSLFEKFDIVNDNDRSSFPIHELVPSEGLASTIVPGPLNLAYLRDRVVCRDIANLEMSGYAQRDHESRDELEIAVSLAESTQHATLHHQHQVPSISTTYRECMTIR